MGRKLTIEVAQDLDARIQKLERALRHIQYFVGRPLKEPLRTKVINDVRKVLGDPPMLDYVALVKQWGDSKGRPG